ncbi:MAG: CoA transferase [Chloroflexi bacterium]|nr:CoA transferase [Chloroflexota bacterium]
MLSPYTVLDLTGGHGDLASMLLGDMGAKVIKVEPPAGSAGRGEPPFIEGGPELERSLPFFAFNRNKMGIILDLEAEAGRNALRGLVETADFIFESGQPATLDSLGLGFDVLKEINPKIIHVAISAYGCDGPYADYAASDLTIAAMGGPMSLQGVPDRAPVRISVPQVWLHAGSEAATAALTAHALMLRTGEAQFVDVSAQTAMIATMLQGISAHAIQGQDYQRAGSLLQLGQANLPVVFECADGYIVLIPSGPTLAVIVPWFVEDGVVPESWIEGEIWPTYHVRLLQGQPVSYSAEEVLAAITKYVANYTKNHLLERGLREGVALAPVNDIGDLTGFQQLEERGYWMTAPLPNGLEARAPGLVVRLSETPMSVKSWAPALGEHNGQVLNSMLGLDDTEINLATGGKAG